MKATHFIVCIKRAIVLAGVTALICGCASGLSKDECNTADWYSIGYEDGVHGRSETQISDHRKACAKHGVSMNLDNYRSGWQEGVARYCQPGNGYSQGRTGKRYAGICPNALEVDFLQAYREGRELYKLEVNVQRTARRLNQKRNRLADVEVEMRDAGIELVTEGISTEQRVILLDELRKLEEERAATRAEIPSIEAELERQEKALARLSAQQDY